MSKEQLEGLREEMIKAACTVCFIGDSCRHKSKGGKELGCDCVREEVAAILALPPIKVALTALERISLFQLGNFTFHSGGKGNWKVDCDALTDVDVETLAVMIAEKHRFGRVVGVPQGGLRLATALEPYCTSGYPTLIVDDVLTTGASMEALKAKVEGEVIGIVIFARGLCPDWVTPLWQDGDTVLKALAVLADLEAGRLVRVGKSKDRPHLRDVMTEARLLQADIERRKLSPNDTTHIPIVESCRVVLEAKKGEQN